jgi:hypothetical protein
MRKDMNKKEKDQETIDWKGTFEAHATSAEEPEP